MSHKMYSIAFPLLMLCASSALALEGAIYNSVENTFTIPIVNVDDQTFYYLELSGSAIETEVRFDIEEARGIGPQDNSDAYFSTATSRLSLANVDAGVDGGQWVINLDLVQGSSQLMLESMLLPTLDTEGQISEVEYIDNSMEHFTYRFNEQGKIDHIETELMVYSFREDGSVNVFANYGAPNWGTHVGDLSPSDLDSAVSLYYFFRWATNTHLSEATSNEGDYLVTYERNMNYRSIAKALSIPSWLFACASAAVSNNSWEAIVEACEAPLN